MSKEKARKQMKFRGKKKGSGWKKDVMVMIVDTDIEVSGCI